MKIWWVFFCLVWVFYLQCNLCSFNVRSLVLSLLAAFKYLNKLHSCLKKWLKMKTWEFHFVQQNIFINSLCDCLLSFVAQISWILLGDKYCNKFWLISLVVEFFCLNTSTMRYFHQSWSPCSAFAASAEPARRVKRASGGLGAGHLLPRWIFVLNQACQTCIFPFVGSEGASVEL